jgi:hypothetical protein
MSEAIKLIVEGYVSLKNRAALEELQAHRQRLRRQLQEQKDVIGLGRATELFDEDLRVIEAALMRI